MKKLAAGCILVTCLALVGCGQLQSDVAVMEKRDCNLANTGIRMAEGQFTSQVLGGYTHLSDAAGEVKGDVVPLSGSARPSGARCTWKFRERPRDGIHWIAVEDEDYCELRLIEASKWRRGQPYFEVPCPGRWLAN